MQLSQLSQTSPADLRSSLVKGGLDVAALISASGAPASPAGSLIGCFTPSLGKLPATVIQEAGPNGAFIGDLCMRRIWQVGPAVYQPLAAHLALPGVTPPEHVDLLVRRKYTVEPVTVVANGSPVAALLRALGALAYLRRPEIAAPLTAELSRRNVNAGIVEVTELKQAMVVGRPEVFAARVDLAADLEAIAALKRQLEGGPLGFRFVEAQGTGDDITLRLPPQAWQEAGLVRSV